MCHKHYLVQSWWKRRGAKYISKASDFYQSFAVDWVPKWNDTLKRGIESKTARNDAISTPPSFFPQVYASLPYSLDAAGFDRLIIVITKVSQLYMIEYAEQQQKWDITNWKKDRTIGLHLAQ